MTMRVLFPLHGYVGWNGGIDLVRLLTTAIQMHAQENALELCFALPAQRAGKQGLIATLRCWRELRAGVLGKPGIMAGGAAALRVSAKDLAAGHSVFDCTDDAKGVVDAARRARADIVFPTMLPLGSSRIPRVSYLFDFQHRRLPQLFSARTRRNRDRQFKRIALDANVVVVNSLEVARDAQEFLGLPRDRLLVLPFSPYAQPWWFDLPVEDVLEQYGLLRPYFLVCNHFWAHKDHATALYAFAALVEHMPERRLTLVMTGDPVDHRDPVHYARLIELAHKLGITADTRFLGLIPKPDQLALLRGCRALVQPTMFEGGPGGGSVYEAIGLGVPVIASDIPINREIDTGAVTFFTAGDATSLAQRLQQALESQCESQARDTLLHASERSLLRLGESIVDCLKNILGQQLTR